MSTGTFDSNDHIMGFTGAASAGSAPRTAMSGATTAVLPPMPPAPPASPSLAALASTGTASRPKVETLSFGTAATPATTRDDDADAAEGRASRRHHRASHTRSGVTRAMRGAGTATRRRNPWPIVVAALIATILAALIAYFFIGNWYFQGKAAPGVRIGGTSVAGQTRDQLAATVQGKIDATKVTFDANGKTVTASLKDLGVTPDADATTDALLNAKPSGTFTATVARLNPFAHADTPLTATTSDGTAQMFATDGLVDETDRAEATTIAYADQSKQFDVVPGKDGKQTDAAAVNAAVAQAIAEPGQAKTVPVALVAAKNPVTDASAQKARDDANARLALAINVNNGADNSIAIPAARIAQWISAKPDETTGDLKLTVDTNAIDAYLKQDDVVKELTVPMVTEEVFVRPQSEGGTPIGADKTLGRDGIAVTGNGDATNAIAAAIQNGQPADATVATKVTPHDVKNVEVPHDFDKPNGSKWVHVDLTNQTATAYEGTTVVKNFLIASGQYTADGSRLSATGTFYVYLKYEQQTMTGPGYSQPTPWISYYNGSEALHAVPPYLWGDHPIYVEQGIPGSHGCINMQVADGKWMYDWADVGTRVVVDGTTPSSGKPIREAGPDATNYQG